MKKSEFNNIITFFKLFNKLFPQKNTYYAVATDPKFKIFESFNIKIEDVIYYVENVYASIRDLLKFLVERNVATINYIPIYPNIYGNAIIVKASVFPENSFQLRLVFNFYPYGISFKEQLRIQACSYKHFIENLKKYNNIIIKDEVTKEIKENLVPSPEIIINLEHAKEIKELCDRFNYDSVKNAIINTPIPFNLYEATEILSKLLPVVNL